MGTEESRYVDMEHSHITNWTEGFEPFSDSNDALSIAVLLTNNVGEMGDPKKVIATHGPYLFHAVDTGLTYTSGCGWVSNGAAYTKLHELKGERFIIWRRLQQEESLVPERPEIALVHATQALVKKGAGYKEAWDFALEIIKQAKKEIIHEIGK